VYDLSQPIADGMTTYPGDPAVQVAAARTMESDGYRVTGLGCGSHSGTHVDAPAHTEPDGRSLDAFQVDRFAGRATVVDCRDLGARDPITPERVPETDADYLVFRTGWDDHWNTPRYRDHPYLAPETARRCARAGYDVGMDTLGPDPTPSPSAGADEPDGFSAHHALLGAGRLLVENLTGLGAAPDRFELRAYPLALGADGAPVRAVGVPLGAGVEGRQRERERG
jgi:kynurenine formamidase